MSIHHLCYLGFPQAEGCCIRYRSRCESEGRGPALQCPSPEKEKNLECLQQPSMRLYCHRRNDRGYGCKNRVDSQLRTSNGMQTHMNCSKSALLSTGSDDIARGLRVDLLTIDEVKRRGPGLIPKRRESSKKKRGFEDGKMFYKTSTRSRLLWRRG